MGAPVNHGGQIVPLHHAHTQGLRLQRAAVQGQGAVGHAAGDHPTDVDGAVAEDVAAHRSAARGTGRAEDLAVVARPDGLADGEAAAHGGAPNATCAHRQLRRGRSVHGPVHGAAADGDGLEAFQRRGRQAAVGAAGAQARDAAAGERAHREHRPQRPGRHRVVQHHPPDSGRARVAVGTAHHGLAHHLQLPAGAVQQAIGPAALGITHLQVAHRPGRGVDGPDPHLPERDPALRHAHVQQAATEAGLRLHAQRTCHRQQPFGQERRGRSAVIQAEAHQQLRAQLQARRAQPHRTAGAGDTGSSRIGADAQGLRLRGRPAGVEDFTAVVDPRIVASAGHTARPVAGREPVACARVVPGDDGRRGRAGGASQADGDEGRETGRPEGRQADAVRTKGFMFLHHITWTGSRKHPRRAAAAAGAFG